jgi:CheY-like chemotaxis protein
MVVSRRSPGLAAEARKPSLLLVEDNPVTAAMLEAQLRELRPDADVRVFADGFSALLDAGRQVPDLLITDIDLPGLDGLAMVRQLRENPSTQPMRIVLVTSHSATELSRFGSLPEGVPLLHKPVSNDALASAIGVAAGNGASTDAA